MELKRIKAIYFKINLIIMGEKGDRIDKIPNLLLYSLILLFLILEGLIIAAFESDLGFWFIYVVLTVFLFLNFLIMIKQIIM